MSAIIQLLLQRAYYALPNPSFFLKNKSKRPLDKTYPILTPKSKTKNAVAGQVTQQHHCLPPIMPEQVLK
jgi:hypothetical protein